MPVRLSTALRSAGPCTSAALHDWNRPRRRRLGDREANSEQTNHAQRQARQEANALTWVYQRAGNSGSQHSRRLRLSTPVARSHTPTNSRSQTKVDASALPLRRSRTVRESWWPSAAVAPSAFPRSAVSLCGGDSLQTVAVPPARESPVRLPLPSIGVHQQRRPLMLFQLVLWTVGVAPAGCSWSEPACKSSSASQPDLPTGPVGLDWRDGTSPSGAPNNSYDGCRFLLRPCSLSRGRKPASDDAIDWRTGAAVGCRPGAVGGAKRVRVTHRRLKERASRDPRAHSLRSLAAFHASSKTSRRSTGSISLLPPSLPSCRRPSSALSPAPPPRPLSALTRTRRSRTRSRSGGDCSARARSPRTSRMVTHGSHNGLREKAKCARLVPCAAHIR